MTTNSTISCDWPSAKALVGGIDEDKLNISDIVKQCDNVCRLAFGSKKPDIAGEGIMISSMIQISLICLLGILLPGLIWFLNHRSPHPIAPTTVLLRKLQLHFFATNGFLSISFLLAIIVIYTPTPRPSVLEISFLSQFSSLQQAAMLGTIWAQFADSMLNGTSARWQWIVYYCAIFIAQSALTTSIKIPHLKVYKSLGKECHRQNQFAIVAFLHSSTANDNGSMKWLGIVFGIGIGIAILSPLLIVPGKWIWNRVPELLKKYGHVVWLGVSLWIYVAATVLSALTTEFARFLVKETSASEVKWGYGQTTAILLWIPFIWAVVKETRSHFKRPKLTKNTEAEMQSMEQGRAPPSIRADVVPPPYTADAAPPPQSRSTH